MYHKKLASSFPWQPTRKFLFSNSSILLILVFFSMALVYNPNKLHFTRDVFILSFSGSLWLVFISLLLFLAICLRFATYQYSLIKSCYEDWTWVEITLWAVAAACQQGILI